MPHSMTIKNYCPLKALWYLMSLNWVQTYEITIFYMRPSTCHAFNDIYYRKHQNERTVAVVSTVFQSNGNCTNLEDTELEASFDFKATESGS